MLCYSVMVDVNEEFNKDILLDYYFNWLNTTRNKMDGLNYNQESSYVYEVHNKKIRIEDFHEHSLFGIYFSTRDNEKNFEFNVEILYNYDHSTLLLNFYKKMHEDSKNITALSIPRIFRTLLSSEYILKDYNLKIKDQPYFYDLNRYEKIMHTPHDFPVVVLTKNKKCLVNPYHLASSLYTVGHVVVVNTHNKPTATIFYPEGEIEDVSDYPKQYLSQTITDKVRIYVLENNLQHLTFDDYMKLRLESKHNERIEDISEFESYFNNEISDLNNQLMKLKQDYSQYYKTYEALLKQKEELENSTYNNKEILLVTKQDNVKEIQNILFGIINDTLRDLQNHETYRKRDILLSIKEEL